MPASALIDEHALPHWLRAQPQMPEASAPAGGAAQWAAPSSREQPPASWFGGAAGQPAPPAVPAVSPFGGYPQEPHAPPPGTLSAGHFVDDTALPGWLRAQGASGGAPAPMPAAAMPPMAMPPVAEPTGRVPAPGASVWGAPAPAQPSGWLDPSGGPPGGAAWSPAVAGNQAADYLETDGVNPSPSWMSGDQAGYAPRSGELSARELPPWLRDGQAAGAMPPGNDGRMPGFGDGAWQDAGRMPDPPWDGRQWGGDPEWGQDPQDPYAQQGYGPPQGYAQPGQQPGYPEQDGYGEYGPDEQDDYDSYDPYGYDLYQPYTGQDPRDAPPEQPRGRWRRIFRRK